MTRGDASREPAEPSPTPSIALQDTPRIGLMYWAPPTYVLGGEFALIVGGEVVAVRREPPGQPEIRGEAEVPFATVRIERVFLDHPPAPRPDAQPQASLARAPRIEVEGADHLAVGDRVIVFVEAYDGGYGIVPKRDTETAVGIRVASWSAPIVGALERWLAGRADLTQARDTDPWRRYGEPAIACARDGVPASQCGLE